jgi:hypothetical protein
VNSDPRSPASDPGAPRAGIYSSRRAVRRSTTARRDVRSGRAGSAKPASQDPRTSARQPLDRRQPVRAHRASSVGCRATFRAGTPPLDQRSQTSEPVGHGFLEAEEEAMASSALFDIMIVMRVRYAALAACVVLAGCSSVDIKVRNDTGESVRIASCVDDSIDLARGETFDATGVLDHGRSRLSCDDQLGFAAVHGASERPCRPRSGSSHACDTGASVKVRLAPRARPSQNPKDQRTLSGLGWATAKRRAVRAQAVAHSGPRSVPDATRPGQGHGPRR